MPEEDPSKQLTGSPRRPAGEAPSPPPQQSHQFTAVNQAPAGVNGSTKSPTSSMSPPEASPAQSRNAQPPSSFQSAPPSVVQQTRPIPSMMASMGPTESPSAARPHPPPPPPHPQSYAPQMPQAHRPDWHRDASDDSLAHKRKRDEEIDGSGRAISPTTQTARHHLAAHEAAMGGFGGGHHHPTQTPGGDNYSYDRRSTGDDEGESPNPHDGSAQHDQPEKKRKRQFANRTKTGCITCRRRKKKCDEGKPECTFSISPICLPPSTIFRQTFLRR